MKISSINESYFNDKEETDININDVSRNVNNNSINSGYCWVFSFESSVSRSTNDNVANNMPWNLIISKLRFVFSKMQFFDNYDIEVNVSCGKYDKYFGRKYNDINKFGDFMSTALDTTLLNNHECKLKVLYAISFTIDDEFINNKYLFFKYMLLYLNKWICNTSKYYDGLDKRSCALYSNTLKYHEGDDYSIIISRYNVIRLRTGYIEMLYEIFSQHMKTRFIGDGDDDSTNEFHLKDKFEAKFINKDPSYLKKLIHFLKHSQGKLDNNTTIIWTLFAAEPVALCFNMYSNEEIDGSLLSKEMFEKCFNGLSLRRKLELTYNGKGGSEIIIVIISENPVHCTQFYYTYNDDISSNITITYKFVFMKDVNNFWCDGGASEDVKTEIKNIAGHNRLDIHDVENNRILPLKY